MYYLFTLLTFQTEISHVIYSIGKFLPKSEFWATFCTFLFYVGDHFRGTIKTRNWFNCQTEGTPESSCLQEEIKILKVKNGSFSKHDFHRISLPHHQSLSWGKVQRLLSPARWGRRWTFSGQPRRKVRQHNHVMAMVKLSWQDQGEPIN